MSDEMSDEIREAFEKGTKGYIWEGDEKADAWLFFQSGYKSRDPEVQRLEAEKDDLQDALKCKGAILRASLTVNNKLRTENKKLRELTKDLSTDELYWENCPNCDNEGFWIGGSTDDPEQMPCEFCYTNARSVFNQNRIKQALKDGE